MKKKHDQTKPNNFLNVSWVQFLKVVVCFLHSNITHMFLHLHVLDILFAFLANLLAILHTFLETTITKNIVIQFFDKSQNGHIPTFIYTFHSIRFILSLKFTAKHLLYMNLLNEFNIEFVLICFVLNLFNIWLILSLSLFFKW